MTYIINTRYSPKKNGYRPPKTAKVYWYCFENENEKFYKVGYTNSLLLENRWKRNTDPYNKRLVWCITCHSKSEMKFVEKEILSRLQYFRYTPLVKFGGHTECFSLDSLPRLRELFTYFTKSVRTRNILFEMRRGFII